MTITTINWNFRKDLYLVKGPALHVLLSLITHANGNMRAWPSIKTLHKETGYSNKPIVEALKQLEKISAIVKVPFDKRMEVEQHLHKRKAVYQLTGMYAFDDIKGEYLLLNALPPEAIESLLITLKSLSFSQKIGKSVVCEILQCEISESTHKGSTGSSKGGTEKKSILSPKSGDDSTALEDDSSHDDYAELNCDCGKPFRYASNHRTCSHYGLSRQDVLERDDCPECGTVLIVNADGICKNCGCHRAVAPAITCPVCSLEVNHGHDYLHTPDGITHVACLDDSEQVGPMEDDDSAFLAKVYGDATDSSCVEDATIVCDHEHECSTCTKFDGSDIVQPSENIEQLTPKMAAVLEKMARVSTSYHIVGDKPESRFVIGRLQSDGYIVAFAGGWRVTTTGRAALEAYRAQQKPTMTELARFTEETITRHSDYAPNNLMVECCQRCEMLLTLYHWNESELQALCRSCYKRFEAQQSKDSSGPEQLETPNTAGEFVLDMTEEEKAELKKKLKKLADEHSPTGPFITVVTEWPQAEQALIIFTEDELKQLATAFVYGHVSVADYNREICAGLEAKGYLKVRGQSKGKPTSYKLQTVAQTLCENPSDDLAQEIKRKQDVRATVEGRKAEAKKKRRKNKDKAPPDITTMPEIQDVAEALCDIHFDMTFSLIDDSDKRTIVTLANKYRNQGADTGKKVRQIHDHYREQDWYKGLSIWGLTNNMRIQQALAAMGKVDAVEQDKPFTIEEEIEG